MKRILFTFCLLIAPFVCQASNVDILLMGGPSLSNISNDSRVSLNQDMVNAYKTQSQSHTQPVLGIGVAHTFANFNKPISLSLGVSSYYVDHGYTKGIEHPFINDGIFDPLNYKFQARSQSFLVESRLLYTNYAWQPYVLAGIGEAWNHLYHYSESPINPSNSASAALYPFSNHTQSTFAYEIGLGVQRQIFNNVSKTFHYYASLDYRYMSNGKGELGRSPIQNSNDHLQVSNYNIQALMFSLIASL